MPKSHRSTLSWSSKILSNEGEFFLINCDNNPSTALVRQKICTNENHLAYVTMNIFMGHYDKNEILQQDLLMLIVHPMQSDQKDDTNWPVKSRGWSMTVVPAQG